VIQRTYFSRKRRSPPLGTGLTPGGFSLIELMVAVAIVGLLAAIAYPSYQSYLVRNNRAAAQSALMDIAQRQQQYLLDARAYAANLTALNVTLPANVTASYTVAIALTAGPPPTFTATATPVAGTRQAADGALSIDQSGAKSPANKW
jgi:type IV pilus assembly protein PilE